MAANQANLDHVVAIGASAGGLDAIQELIRNLTLEGNVAYIVAQHLAPDHPSLLADLLGRATHLKVVPAGDGMTLEPGQIMVLPPNGDATLEGQTLSIREPQPRFGPRSLSPVAPRSSASTPRLLLRRMGGLFEERRRRGPILPDG